MLDCFKMSYRIKLPSVDLGKHIWNKKFIYADLICTSNRIVAIVSAACIYEKLVCKTSNIHSYWQYSIQQSPQTFCKQQSMNNVLFRLFTCRLKKKVRFSWKKGSILLKILWNWGKNKEKKNKYIRESCYAGGKFCPACWEINIFSKPAT